MKYLSIGLTAAVGLGVTAPAFAQDTDSAEQQSQQVVVTGTRQATRTVAESLAPITVISAKELNRVLN